MSGRDRLTVAGLSLLLAALGAVMLVSFTGSGQVQSSAGASPSPATSAQAGVYREGLISHPNSINPLTPATAADRDLVALLFRGLVRAGPNGTLLPDLATSWTASADGKTYTFDLRSDARWDDGEPVTATDVVFTVTLAQDPDYEGPLGASWQGIKAEAVSPTVVKFTLPTPLGGFLRQASLPVLPEHLLADTDVTALADSDFSARPVGDGPFRIAALDDSHALLTRDGTYYSLASPSVVPSESAAATTAPPETATPDDAASPAESFAPSAAPSLEGPGNVRAIDFRFFDDTASAVAAFKNGQLDAVGGLTPQDSAAAATRDGSTVTRYPWADLYSVVLNQRSAHPEFADLNVRKALLASIDRQTVVTAVLAGYGSPADVPLPAWSSWYDPASVAATAYSQTDAAADLTAAGWTKDAAGWTAPDGKSPYSLRLLSPDKATDPVAYRVAQKVVGAWRTIGLTVSWQAPGANDYLAQITNGDFDAVVVDYHLGLDPDVSALLLSNQAAPAGSNLSGIADKTLDGLLTTVRTTSDPTARRAAVSALEKYLSANVLVLPVCFADYEFVLSGRLDGVSSDQIADPSGRFWDVLDWRLASDG
jgi:peptide/nickel transport system substrate-binding protein